MTEAPSEMSNDELAEYLKELLDDTEELNARMIEVHVHDDIVHLVGEVASELQSDLAQMLVMDLVGEKVVNELDINPDLDVQTQREPYREPSVELEEEQDDVEWDDPDAAAQQGRTYEPPVAPTPEPRHDEEW